jgi:hypothetical protein
VTHAGHGPSDLEEARPRRAGARPDQRSGNSIWSGNARMLILSA